MRHIHVKRASFSIIMVVGLMPRHHEGLNLPQLCFSPTAGVGVMTSPGATDLQINIKKRYNYFHNLSTSKCPHRVIILTPAVCFYLFLYSLFSPFLRDVTKCKNGTLKSFFLVHTSVCFHCIWRLLTLLMEGVLFRTIKQ